MNSYAKKALYLPILAVLFFSFAFGAQAAGSSQTRLITMQNDGNQVNYEQPYVAVFNASQPAQVDNKAIWSFWYGFMITSGEIIIGAAVLFLLSMVITSFMENYKRNPIRMHSHSMARRRR